MQDYLDTANDRIQVSVMLLNVFFNLILFIFRSLNTFSLTVFSHIIDSHSYFLQELQLNLREKAKESSSTVSQVEKLK